MKFTAKMPHDELRSLIHEARLEAENPNSQPSVRHTMLGSKFLPRIERKAALRRLAIALGLESEIRRVLKNDLETEDGVTSEQVLQWPLPLQELVTDIDRARVFVPSRHEFVPLVPDELSKQETIEAGEYLVAKGEDCIRVGNRLKDLGEKR